MPPTVIVIPITFVIIETAPAVVQPTPSVVQPPSVAVEQTLSVVDTKPTILAAAPAANNDDKNLSATLEINVKEEAKEEILTDTNNIESPLSPDTSDMDDCDEQIFRYRAGNISLTHKRKKHRYY